MKKLTKLLIMTMVLCVALCALVSCEEKGVKVSEEEFKAALDFSGKNLTMNISWESNGSLGSSEHYPSGMGNFFPADPEGDSDGESSGDKVIESTGSSDKNGK